MSDTLFHIDSADTDGLTQPLQPSEKIKFFGQLVQL